MLRKRSLPGLSNLLPTQFADPVGELFESQRFKDSLLHRFIDLLASDLAFSCGGIKHHWKQEINWQVFAIVMIIVPAFMNIICAYSCLVCLNRTQKRTKGVGCEGMAYKWVKIESICRQLGLMWESDALIPHKVWWQLENWRSPTTASAAITLMGS